METPVFLGPDQRMLGILSDPDSISNEGKNPIVLLLNAGLVHRVGPNRLNVNIARTLAAKDFTSIRFDMSGIGDSHRSTVERSYVDQSIADVVEAMDSLELETGVDEFVVVGLCTGAYNALEAASADPRVRGCILIDGYAYPTARFTITHQTKRILQLWRWKRYLMRRLGFKGSGSPTEQPDDVLVFQPEDMDKDEFARRINSLTARGTYVHFVFTGFGPQPYNYRGQMLDAFPDFDRDQISVLYVPGATHTFTLPTHREQLVDSIVDWMVDRFRNETRQKVSPEDEAER